MKVRGREGWRAKHSMRLADSDGRLLEAVQLPAEILEVIGLVFGEGELGIWVSPHGDDLWAESLGDFDVVDPQVPAAWQVRAFPEMGDLVLITYPELMNPYLLDDFDEGRPGGHPVWDVFHRLGIEPH